MVAGLMYTTENVRDWIVQGMQSCSDEEAFKAAQRILDTWSCTQDSLVHAAKFCKNNRHLEELARIFVSDDLYYCNGFFYIWEG